MPLPAIFTKKFYEQVFENRNRNYGAYVLRRSYSRTVILALSLCCAVLLLLAFSSVWFSPAAQKPREAAEATKEKVVVTLPANEYKMVEMRTSPDTAINRSLSGSKTAQPKVSNENIQTKPAAAAAQNVPDLAGSSSSDNFTVPDVDYKSISEYLLEHVEYPADCKKEQTEGLVTVTFYVENDGTLSRPRVTQSDDARMSEAVLKAFREMPNCKASKTSDSRMMCRLPVRFSLNK